MRVQETNNAKLRQKDADGKKSSSNKIETVHAVYILDASGSMAGSKYRAATEGIDADIEVLRGVKDVNYTLTVIEFDSIGWGAEKANITEHTFMQPIHEIGTIRYRGAHGGTPLNQTVGETIDKLERLKGADKVILNIFTDGEENSSQGQYKNTYILQTRIKSAEANGFTITFQGTKQDIQHVVQHYGIHASNTLAHENTANSILRGSKLRAASMVNYSKAVADGLDVKENFYTKTLQEETN
jgi:uncharacterized protein YegL